MSAGINVVVDDKSVKRALARLSAANLGKLLENVGSDVEAQTRIRIAVTKLDPRGKRWVKWSDNYQLQQDESRPGASLLYRDKNLYDSIQSQVWGRNLLVGSDMVYASTHQWGSRARRKGRRRKNKATGEMVMGVGKQVIPARPYLGLSTADKRSVKKITREFLRGLLKK